MFHIPPDGFQIEFTEKGAATLTFHKPYYHGEEFVHLPGLRDPEVRTKVLVELMRRHDSDLMAATVRGAIDRQLEVLHKAIQTGDTEKADACRDKLGELRRSAMLLELL